MTAPTETRHPDSLEAVAERFGHELRGADQYCRDERIDRETTFMGGVAVRCEHIPEPLRYTREVPPEAPVAEVLPPDPRLPATMGAQLEEDATTHSVQAAGEGVEAPLEIEFFGHTFRLAEKIALSRLMAFAVATQQGLDTDDMGSLAAMSRLVQACLYRPVLIEPAEIPDPDAGPGEDGEPRMVPNPKAGQRMRDPETGRLVRDESEWLRFDAVADEEDADDQDYDRFMKAAMEAIAARPQTRRGNSSGTSPATSVKSRATSSSTDIPGLVPVSELGR